MAIDIIEEVRKYIGSQPVPKVDPNTQAPEIKKAQSPDLGSAIIPALLVGFYKHSRNKDQAAELLKENNPDNILEILFGNEKNYIIKSVSHYSGVSENNADSEMRNATAAIKKVLVKEIENPDGKSVSNFFTDQRSNILKHLPAELNMGELIKDPSVDDRTNKMEGPMSGMMHTIEKIFSSTK
ncbi:MAG TPA: hypothetical protein VGI61_09120 [Parafilimonas sp.]